MGPILKLNIIKHILSLIKRSRVSMSRFGNKKNGTFSQTNSSLPSCHSSFNKKVFSYWNLKIV